MKLSKGWKIAIGILTVLVAVYPFILGPAMMIIMFANPETASIFQRAFLPPEEFFTKLMVPMMLYVYPVMMCVTLLQLCLQIFYVAIVIQNKQLSDVTRILFALAMFFMPFIGMPVYFVAYVWMDKTTSAVSPAAVPA